MLSHRGFLHLWQCQMKLCRSHHWCNLLKQSLSSLSETGKGLRVESMRSDVNPPWYLLHWSFRFFKLPERRQQIEKNGLNN